MLFRIGFAALAATVVTAASATLRAQSLDEAPTANVARDDASAPTEHETTEAAGDTGERASTRRAPQLPLRGARRPYRVDWLADLIVLGATGSLWAVPEFMLDELVPRGRCPCDPAQLNALDRPTAGVSAPWAAVPSNIATIAFLALPATLDIVDVWRSRGTAWEWVEDAVVMGEALVVTGAAHQLARLTFQRPRPLAYGIDPSDSRLTQPNAYSSFYSLSAAQVTSSLLSGAVTFWMRHPTSNWRWVYLSSSIALSLGFGVTRSLVGAHFPTDVLVAWTMGTLVGVGIPLLHQRRDGMAINASVTGQQASVGLSMRWF